MNHPAETYRRLPDAVFWKICSVQKNEKHPILLVPGERIELPTNGLQRSL